MTPDPMVVLRNLPLDPRPRVLGRRPESEPGPEPRSTPFAVPADGAFLSARLAAALDEGLRRGRDEARRDTTAAFESERAAQAKALTAAREEAEASARAHQAARLAETEAARRSELLRAATADDLRRSIERAAAAARDTLLDDALVLAFEATARFVGEAATAGDASTRRERLRALVAQAAATSLGGRPLLRVRLHPGDLALLGDGSPTTWTAVADTAVDPGGCRLETAQGSLDARLATQFDRLRALWSEGGCPA